MEIVFLGHNEVMDSKDDLPNPNAPFTAAEAKRMGLPPGRLRRKAYAKVSHGIHRPVAWEFDLLEAARALSAASPGAWISHVTAARIHGCILPAWLSDSNELHLSKPRKLPEVRRRGIFGHTVVSFPDEVEFSQGLWISTRSRTWLDLARTLPLRDLVCLGDQLLRVPRPEFENRSKPYATLESLHAMVDRHPNLQGIVRAREALELMRVGADSATESLMRLAMGDAGLPEPELQLKLWASPTAPSADAGYRERRIALQYDGAHHLSESQQRSDRRRDAAFKAAGWQVLIFTDEDLADGFDQAVHRIKEALRHAWIDPAIDSGFAAGE